MKRLILGIFSVLLLAFIASDAQAVNVQDFKITNYDIQYELSRDEDSRSILQATETITAQFPNVDQNHGIERAIPTSYDNHPTSLKIESIKKTDGSDWQYQIRSENGNDIVRIGDPDEYIRGQQKFIISYSQRDVTKAFSNTSDEFYWDTNGNDWAVAIEKINVTLRVDGSLAPQLNNSVACYQGVAGSTNVCDISRTSNTYSVRAFDLAPGQNVTLAIGFTKDTFGNYEQSSWEKVVGAYIAVTVVVGAIAFGLIIWMIVRATKWSERKHERGTIVAEYTPPKDTSVTAAASLLAVQGSVFSAQLLDFAVRGYIKVYEAREKSFWKSAEYDIEVTKNISDLKDEEQEILRDIFAGNAALGSKLELKKLKNNTGLYKRITDNDKKLKDLIRGEYGLRHKDDVKSGWFKKAGFILLVFSIMLLNPALLVASLIAFVCGATLWPLTDKGLALTMYLEGLKDYIKVAEVDRIKMLQSPEGAEKIGNVDLNDRKQLLKLYERVLPYAVLFGQEKEWTKRIGDIYETSGGSPGWYAGNNAVFNAAVFSSAVSGFSTAASYSSASSSSSGGSAGGGSSGGGGGGGGGGGW